MKIGDDDNKIVTSRNKKISPRILVHIVTTLFKTEN